MIFAHEHVLRFAEGLRLDLDDEGIPANAQQTDQLSSLRGAQADVEMTGLSDVIAEIEGEEMELDDEPPGSSIPQPQLVGNVPRSSVGQVGTTAALHHQAAPTAAAILQRSPVVQQTAVTTPIITQARRAVISQPTSLIMVHDPPQAQSS